MAERKVGTPAESRKKQVAGEVAVRKAPRPSGCRRYTRVRAAEAMPELVDALIRKSAGGSLGHMRLLVQLGGLDEAPVAKPKRGDGTVKALMDEWREREGQREA